MVLCFKSSDRYKASRGMFLGYQKENEVAQPLVCKVKHIWILAVEGSQMVTLSNKF